MPRFYLGDITQSIMDEYFTAFSKLNGQAGISESETIRHQRIPLCLKMFR